MVSLTLGLCAVILTAAINQPAWHLVATGLISVVFAILAIRENHALIAQGATKNVIAASTARYIGLIWTWGAIGLLVIYSLIFEGHWAEWWQFFIGFLFAAVGSIVFANMLTRDAEAGREDPAVIKLGRVLVMVLLVGMVIAIASLFIDGKFPRDTSHPDWAACNIFFFGALSVGAMCINALLSSKA
jgi:hypothetical protein